ncbi:MAG: redoxin domain-containing protein [Phycisphaera sp.]|nr:redoxin domain-containing protein [Phycisphaera sp.]
MVMTPSTMRTLGTPAPDFTLPDTNPALPAESVSLSDFAGKPLVVAFICNHCPFVKHLADAFAAFATDVQANGVAVVAISANDVATHPADSPEKMGEEATARGYTFPYLYDESQDVAKAYTAACTPDFFLFDADHKLYYRGQFDDSRPNRISSGVYDSSASPATGEDLRAAVDALLAGEPAPDKQLPSIGCNIKWKSGSAPSYFGG